MAYTKIHAKTIRIMGPDWTAYLSKIGEGNNNDAFEAFDKANQAVVDNLGGALANCEELISNSLPEGFYCKIED